jgi:hypothetical protein
MWKNNKRPAGRLRGTCSVEKQQTYDKQACTQTTTPHNQNTHHHTATNSLQLRTGSWEGGCHCSAHHRIMQQAAAALALRTILQQVQQTSTPGRYTTAPCMHVCRHYKLKPQNGLPPCKGRDGNASAGKLHCCSPMQEYGVCRPCNHRGAAGCSYCYNPWHPEGAHGAPTHQTLPAAPTACRPTIEESLRVPTQRQATGCQSQTINGNKDNLPVLCQNYPPAPAHILGATAVAWHASTCVNSCIRQRCQQLYLSLGSPQPPGSSALCSLGRRMQLVLATRHKQTHTHTHAHTPCTTCKGSTQLPTALHTLLLCQSTSPVKTTPLLEALLVLTSSRAAASRTAQYASKSESLMKP